MRRASSPATSCPPELQRELYRNTDVGVFPNRCEGGTNLVLMEYMACGKPVIASCTSGHRDIVSEEMRFLLKRSERLPHRRRGPAALRPLAGTVPG